MILHRVCPWIESPYAVPVSHTHPGHQNPERKTATHISLERADTTSRRRPSVLGSDAEAMSQTSAQLPGPVVPGSQERRTWTLPSKLPPVTTHHLKLHSYASPPVRNLPTSITTHIYLLPVNSGGRPRRTFPNPATHARDHNCTRARGCGRAHL